MAEGDTILRAARIARLDGRRLERVESHGKHLLLCFGDLVLHSHLGMGGSWQVGERGARWRKPAGAAWAVLAPDFDPAVVLVRLRASGEDELGAALLDQRLLAGVGNIFKSEASFAARVDPWRQVGELTDEQLTGVLEAARRLMLESVERGRPSPSVYRRAGRPCPVCGEAIAARGQGDANRRTYWCPRCQAGESRAK